jgi:hypothetical protein
MSFQTVKKTSGTKGRPEAQQREVDKNPTTLSRKPGPAVAPSLRLGAAPLRGGAKGRGLAAARFPSLPRACATAVRPRPWPRRARSRHLRRFLSGVAASAAS